MLHAENAAVLKIITTSTLSTDKILRFILSTLLSMMRRKRRCSVMSGDKPPGYIAALRRLCPRSAWVMFCRRRRQRLGVTAMRSHFYRWGARRHTERESWLRRYAIPSGTALTGQGFSPSVFCCRKAATKSSFAPSPLSARAAAFALHLRTAAACLSRCFRHWRRSKAKPLRGSRGRCRAVHRICQSACRG